MSKRYTEDDIDKELVAEIHDYIEERVRENHESKKILERMKEHIKDNPDEETEYEYQPKQEELILLKTARI